jgi:hypothetical protein
MHFYLIIWILVVVEGIQLKIYIAVISGSSSSSTIPKLAGEQHDRIANGSKLIAINHDAKQGRFLQVNYCVWCIMHSTLKLL